MIKTTKRKEIKMRKLKLFMAAIVAAVTVVGMSGVSAAAGTVTPTAAQSLKITRTITNAKNNVTNGFDYTITAGASNPAGGVTGFPTTASVDFSNVAPTSGTAKAQGTITMTGATFSKNGDYEWTVTESASDDTTNYPIDSSNTYKIKASVRNAHSSNLSSSEGKTVVFYVYKQGGTEQKLDLTTNPEAFLFTSGSSYKHIEISKEVTGNMADVDLCFDVSVTVGTTGQSYTVSGGCSNPATIAGGTATTLSLKHNDTIIIGQASGVDEIPVNTTYSYSETVPTGYTATNGTLANGTVSSTQSQNVHKITNHYENATITGIFLKVLPYVVIAAIAIAGVVYMIIRNKKQKEMEE